MNQAHAAANAAAKSLLEDGQEMRQINALRLQQQGTAKPLMRITTQTVLNAASKASIAVLQSGADVDVAAAVRSAILKEGGIQLAKWLEKNVDRRSFSGESSSSNNRSSTNSAIHPYASKQQRYQDDETVASSIATSKFGKDRDKYGTDMDSVVSTAGSSILDIHMANEKDALDAIRATAATMIDSRESSSTWSMKGESKASKENNPSLQTQELIDKANTQNRLVPQRNWENVTPGRGISKSTSDEKLLDEAYKMLALQKETYNDSTNSTNSMLKRRPYDPPAQSAYHRRHLHHPEPNVEPKNDPVEQQPSTMTTHTGDHSESYLEELPSTGPPVSTGYEEKLEKKRAKYFAAIQLLQQKLNELEQCDDFYGGSDGSVFDSGSSVNSPAIMNVPPQPRLPYQNNLNPQAPHLQTAPAVSYGTVPPSPYADTMTLDSDLNTVGTNLAQVCSVDSIRTDANSANHYSTMPSDDTMTIDTDLPTLNSDQAQMNTASSLQSPVIDDALKRSILRGRYSVNSNAGSVLKQPSKCFPINEESEDVWGDDRAVFTSGSGDCRLELSSTNIANLDSDETIEVVLVSPEGTRSPTARLKVKVKDFFRRRRKPKKVKFDINCNESSHQTSTCQGTIMSSSTTTRRRGRGRRVRDSFRKIRRGLHLRHSRNGSGDNSTASSLSKDPPAKNRNRKQKMGMHLKSSGKDASDDNAASSLSTAPLESTRKGVAKKQSRSSRDAKVHTPGLTDNRENKTQHPSHTTMHPTTLVRNDTESLNSFLDHVSMNARDSQSYLGSSKASQIGSFSSSSSSSSGGSIHTLAESLPTLDESMPSVYLSNSNSRSVESPEERYAMLYQETWYDTLFNTFAFRDLKERDSYSVSDAGSVRRDNFV